RLEQLTHPVLDLQIAADQFKALDLRNNVAITASGRLSLKGPVFGATLTGQGNVTSGALYFADLVQKRIVNLDELADTSLAALIQQQRLGPEFQNVFLDSLRIEDLELEMGSDVWLRSDEANIQLAGSARLTKQRNQYLVSGTLQAVRGTYRLKVGPVSREFVVTDLAGDQGGIADQRAVVQSALAILSGEIEQTIVSGGVPVDYVEIRPGSGGQGTVLSPWNVAVGRQLGPKTFIVVNAGFCAGGPVGVQNMLGLSLQFRISPEWRTEASFAPVQTCSDATATVVNQPPRQ